MTSISEIAQGIELVKTCGSCPEQYDAYLDGRKVGYLRLRHGEFLVYHPDCDGVLAYAARPRGDGAFQEDEREMYLTTAKFALALEIVRPIRSVS